ncbi:hypothetical protein Pst134EB_027409 [Puccinia striiformis f. sp. tritici]|nr:hypothetical protein Pst134EB_027409 [Puccinia striiformis f. sp. tritici]
MTFPEATGPVEDDVEAEFLQEIFELFQRLPQHKKRGYMTRFSQILDQTHVLKEVNEPIKQPHKGRPNAEEAAKKKQAGEADGVSLRKKKTANESAKSTKRGKADEIPVKRGQHPAKRGRGTALCSQGRPHKIPVESLVGSGDKTSLDEEELPELPLAPMVTRSGRVIKRNFPVKEEPNLTAPEDNGWNETEAAVEDAVQVEKGNDSDFEEENDSDFEEEDWQKFNQAHKHYKSVSQAVWPLIAKIHDVEGDGHCGF